jgi:hypothetical protein
LDSDQPIPFEENRNELLDALDNSGWPIKENDIILLEEEIARAKNFLQQSLTSVTFDTRVTFVTLLTSDTPVTFVTLVTSDTLVTLITAVITSAVVTVTVT